MGGKLVLLQLLVHITLRHGTTLFSQTLVDSIGTIGRGIGTHLDVVEHQALLVGLDILEGGDEVLHRLAVQFATTQVGLSDEELDGSLLLLADDTLEVVGSHTKVSSLGSLGDEGRCTLCAVANLHGRHLHSLLAHLGIELHHQVALLHAIDKRHRESHGGMTAILVGDDGIVSLHLLTLQGERVASRRTPIPLQHRGTLHHSLLVHQLGRHIDADGGRHLTSHILQRRGRHGKVVRHKRFLLTATRQQHHHTRCRHP